MFSEHFHSHLEIKYANDSEKLSKGAWIEDALKYY